METPPFTVTIYQGTVCMSEREREVFSCTVTRAAHLEVVAEMCLLPFH